MLDGDVARYVDVGKTTVGIDWLSRMQGSKKDREIPPPTADERYNR